MNPENPSNGENVVPLSKGHEIRREKAKKALTEAEKKILEFRQEREPEKWGEESKEILKADKKATKEFLRKLKQPGAGDLILSESVKKFMEDLEEAKHIYYAHNLLKEVGEVDNLKVILEQALDEYHQRNI